MLSDKLEKILDENLASLSSLEDEMSVPVTDEEEKPSSATSSEHPAAKPGVPPVERPSVPPVSAPPTAKAPAARHAPAPPTEITAQKPQPAQPAPAAAAASVPMVKPAARAAAAKPVQTPAPKPAERPVPRRGTATPAPLATGPLRPKGRPVALVAKHRRLLTENRDQLSSLEGNLMSAARGKEVRTVFVTSCRRGEGKTSSAIAMAHALATASAGKVVLVEANLANPALHKFFDCRQAPGITDYLLSRADLDDVVQTTEFDNFSIVSRGSDVSSASHAFNPRIFEGKLAALRSKFDYVVFDGDSVLSASNVAMVTKLFDGVAIVVECQRTKWEVLELARSKIDNLGGEVLGVVLNKRRHYIPRGLYAKV